jgi:hypothetical protein
MKEPGERGLTRAVLQANSVLTGVYERQRGFYLVPEEVLLNLCPVVLRPLPKSRGVLRWSGAQATWSRPILRRRRQRRKPGSRHRESVTGLTNGKG